MKLNMFNKLKAFSVDDWMKRMEKGNKRVYPYLVELANEYNEKNNISKRYVVSA